MMYIPEETPGCVAAGCTKCSPGFQLAILAGPVVDESLIRVVGHPRSGNVASASEG